MQSFLIDNPICGKCGNNHEIFLLNAQETELKDIYELKNKIDSLRLLTDFLLYDQLILNGDISLTYEQILQYLNMYMNLFDLQKDSNKPSSPTYCLIPYSLNLCIILFSLYFFTFLLL